MKRQRKQTAVAPFAHALTTAPWDKQPPYHPPKVPKRGGICGSFAHSRPVCAPCDPNTCDFLSFALESGQHHASRSSSKQVIAQARTQLRSQVEKAPHDQLRSGQ